jgi:hypothetical protein
MYHAVYNEAIRQGADAAEASLIALIATLSRAAVRRGAAHPPTSAQM